MYQLSSSIENKIINEAIKQIKKDFKGEAKDFDQDDWYGQLESYIDGLMSDHVSIDIEYFLIADGEWEVILERLVFKAIKKVTKKRHQCDPLA